MSRIALLRVGAYHVLLPQCCGARGTGSSFENLTLNELSLTFLRNVSEILSFPLVALMFLLMFLKDPLVFLRFRESEKA